MIFLSVLLLVNLKLTDILILLIILYVNSPVSGYLFIYVLIKIVQDPLTISSILPLWVQHLIFDEL